VPLSLAAEIQRRLLPASFTCEADQFTLAGWLEPARLAGGDTFDFSVDRHTLHVSITDAVGHSVESALLATLVVGAQRNARRRGAGVVEQARAAHEALLAYARHDGFVTGQLVRVDLVARTAHVLNAGHPRPFRLRRGRAEEIELVANHPLGTAADMSWSEQELSLERGDRIVFLTDGMLERNAEGLDIPALMQASAHLHPRDAIHYLTHAVLGAVGGDLRDDATSLCLDWHGGAQGDRITHAGAEHRTQRNASPQRPDAPMRELVPSTAGHGGLASARVRVAIARRPTCVVGGRADLGPMQPIYRLEPRRLLLIAEQGASHSSPES